MYARRFLWVIAILIMLVIAAAFAYRLFGDRLMQVALVPSVEFQAPPPAPPGRYADPAMWAARPDRSTDPARWTPAGYTAAPRPGVAVFYILPTSVFDRGRWNGDMNDPQVRYRMDLFLRSQASVFNGIGAIWAPIYRQATFGAFLTAKPAARQALDVAYGDVLDAFDAFIAAQPRDRPIILAGHSQGSLHLIRLLKERVAGTPLAGRIVAVYAAGWPISISADLPALGLPACERTDQTGCILSWQSFADPADYSQVRAAFDRGTGLTGDKRLGTRILCTNPLLGIRSDKAAPREANLGSLVPNDDFTGGTLVAKGLGAKCLATGILDIGPPPGAYKAYVLPGNNFHVYDYPLFWANLRADAERRLDSFLTPPAPDRSRRQPRVAAA